MPCSPDEEIGEFYIGPIPPERITLDRTPSEDTQVELSHSFYRLAAVYRYLRWSALVREPRCSAQIAIDRCPEVKRATSAAQLPSLLDSASSKKLLFFKRLVTSVALNC